jgi:hypothetical protein
MQVSWIDETDMTALLGRLREPVPPARTDDDFGDAGTLFEDPAPVPAPEPIMVKEAARIEAEPHADLEDFRSRLQAIRERAMGAGLLPQPMVQEEPLPRTMRSLSGKSLRPSIRWKRKQPPQHRRPPPGQPFSRRGIQ